MNWLRKFMMGRYGGDRLSLALLIFSAVLNLISGLTGFFFLTMIGYIPFGIAFFRIFSRNIPKRCMENYHFGILMSRVYSWVKMMQNRIRDIKTYRYFNCPRCKQSLRVPRGKGKILITCPKCKTEFKAKSGMVFFRIFSRNIGKRSKENYRFAILRNMVYSWVKMMHNRIQDIKNHRYFNCPRCKQSLRVPRGKGKILITCPKCKTEFKAKSGMVFFRIFSRNIGKRSKENYRFAILRNMVYSWVKMMQNRIRDIKTYRYFNCPRCKQSLRVPRGKGKILITCPKCKTEFSAKS